MLTKALLPTFVIACLSTARLAGAEIEPDISANVDKAERLYELKVKKIMQDGQKAILKSKAKVVSEVNKDIKAKMRDDDLSGAQELNEFLEVFEQSDLLQDHFAVQLEQYERIDRIKITKAIARNNRTQEKHDVTKVIQALVDEDKFSFIPGRTASIVKATGIKSHAGLSVEYTFKRQKLNKHINWLGSIDLTPKDAD